MTGVLLDPTIDQDFDFSYRILGHPIRVSSVNLNQPWPDIHRQLLTVIEIPERDAA